MYLTSLSGLVRATVLSHSNDVLSFTAHNSRHYKGDLLAVYQVGYPIKINHSISLKGTTLEIFLTFTRHVFRSPQSRKKKFLRKSMKLLLPATFVDHILTKWIPPDRYAFQFFRYFIILIRVSFLKYFVYQTCEVICWLDLIHDVR